MTGWVLAYAADAEASLIEITGVPHTDIRMLAFLDTGDSGFNITFRHDDNGGTPDYYSFEGTAGGGTFYKVTNGGADTTFGSSVAAGLGRSWWELRVIGTSFSIYKDNVHHLTSTDADFASGIKFEFSNWGAAGRWKGARVWISGDGITIPLVDHPNPSVRAAALRRA